MKHSRWILPIIVISQFFCTSLWFASNAIISDLTSVFSLPQHAVGHLTSAVQFGFICGTFIFALLTIVDRFSPSRIFFISAVLGSFFNFALIYDKNTFISLLIFRFLTGFFLAGIYPVGMKIASDYFEKGLGKSLGFLVGALVLGTAFPHFLQGFSIELSWTTVLHSTSLIALLGGLLMVLFVKDGPYRTKNTKLDMSGFISVFTNKKFRAAAFGYFGHMWELYAFWTFIPIMLVGYKTLHPSTNINVSFWSFLIIGLGGFACILGGYLSTKYGAKKMASIALLLSCCCCLLSPLLFYTNSYIFLSFLVFWGLVVIADSPLFSTLVAKNAPSVNRGTALTIVNCLGFAITIVSIQLISFLLDKVHIQFLLTILAIGPIIGLSYLYKRNSEH